MAALHTDSTTAQSRPSPTPPPPPPKQPRLASQRRAPHLPIDIIVDEILSKLSTKTLLRFKSVCKSFKTIISSQEFARRHSPSSETRFLIVRADNLTVFSYDLDSPSTSSSTFSWPVGTVVSSVCSCNGLVLVSLLVDDILSLVLLNPATQTYVDVPSSVSSARGANLAFGLGFDNLKDDYKIVLVSETIATKVYSVGEKSWKDVVEQHTLQSEMRMITNTMYGGIVINERLLHWTFTVTLPYKPRIVCFDVVSENWTDDVYFPSCYYTPGHRSYFGDIGALDGRLCASFEKELDTCMAGSFLDVWVMKEYGVDDSWVKLMSITTLDFSADEKFVPIASRGEGAREVLLWRQRTGKMSWYNWENSETEDAQIRVCTFMDVHPRVCRASLVTLPDSKVAI